MWLQFWDWVMCRNAGRLLGCITETSQIALKRQFIEIQMLKVILVSEQKEVKSRLEKYIVLKNFMCHHQQNVGRNMNMKSASSEDSEGKRKLVIGHQMTSDPCYETAENLAELSSGVMQKV